LHKLFVAFFFPHFFKEYAMSVTLDIPLHILERASNYAASEGISLDALIARTLATVVNQTHSSQQELSPQRLGRLRGTVLYMADDFDAPLEDFKEYME
jgi:uncharacterized protein YbbC (DUF1343 family)